MFTRRKMAFICLITVFFVISACVNSYATQISALDEVPDGKKAVSTESFGASAMCIPPETDSSERNEKLENSTDIYIRFNRADSMIFSNCISQADCFGIKNNSDKNINIKKGESLTGWVIMRC